MLEACESYLSPLCAYISSDGCLQTTLKRFICCVNLHYYLAAEVYTVIVNSSLFSEESGAHYQDHSRQSVEVAQSFHPQLIMMLVGSVSVSWMSLAPALPPHKTAILALYQEAFMLPDLHVDSLS